MLDIGSSVIAPNNDAVHVVHRCFERTSAAADAGTLGFTHGAVRKVPAGHRLWNEGDARSHVYFLRSGTLCHSRLLSDGRRVVIGFSYPGDMVGLGSSIHGNDCIALQPCRVEALSAASFQRAVRESPELAALAQSEVSHALTSAQDHVIVVSRLAAAERVANFLVDLAERNRRRSLSPSSIVLSMRRIDIADYLGLTIETVSRMLTSFRKAGLIEMRQPTVVFLPGLEKLKRIALGEAGKNQSVRTLAAA